MDYKNIYTVSTKHTVHRAYFDMESGYWKADCGRWFTVCQIASEIVNCPICLKRWNSQRGDQEKE